MKNTHPLRVKLDDPQGFWLHCISELKDDAVRTQREALAPPDGLFDLKKPLCFIVKGERGSLLRRGFLSEDGAFARTLTGHNFVRSLLESYAPLEIIPERELIASLLAKNAFACAIPLKTKQEKVGLLIGDTKLQYSSLLYLDATGSVRQLDIETKENKYNKEHVCALTGVREKARQMVSEAFRALITLPKPAVRAKKRP